MTGEDLTMSFITALSEYILAPWLAEDLPRIAIEALEEGFDSPSLRMLAASEGCDSDTLRQLLAKAMNELGITISRTDAALNLARAIAREVLDGTLTPYEGARRIWWRVYNEVEQLGQLAVFVGLASEIEDDDNPDHQAAYARDIIDECRALIDD